jgi:hypothetical protein
MHDVKGGFHGRPPWISLNLGIVFSMASVTLPIAERRPTREGVVTPLTHIRASVLPARGLLSPPAEQRRPTITDEPVPTF